MMVRIDHFLAEAGCGTRSEVKKLIRAGRVMADGALIKDPGFKTDPEQSRITLDGREVRQRGFTYFMMNKCRDTVSATKDRDKKTVIDLLKEQYPDLPAAIVSDLFPVGRLDIDTEGLLLLTDDGDLAHRLLSPGKHVDKQYEALVDGQVSEEIIACFRDGLDIGDDKKTREADLQVLDYDETVPCTRTLVTIHEGRFHQVKRMFQAVGLHVLALKRLSMGPLKLDPSLESGKSRPLKDEEIRMLQLSSGSLPPLQEAGTPGRS